MTENTARACWNENGGMTFSWQRWSRLAQTSYWRHHSCLPLTKNNSSVKNSSVTTFNCFFQNPSIVCHIMTAPAGVWVVPHAFCSFSEAVRGYTCLSASFPIVRWYYYIQKVYTTWRPISVKHLDVLISVARHRRRQSVFCINSRNTKRPLFFCVLVAAKHFYHQPTCANNDINQNCDIKLCCEHKSKNCRPHQSIIMRPYLFPNCRFRQSKISLLFDIFFL